MKALRLDPPSMLATSRTLALAALFVLTLAASSRTPAAAAEPQRGATIHLAASKIEIVRPGVGPSDEQEAKSESAAQDNGKKAEGKAEGAASEEKAAEGKADADKTEAPAAGDAKAANEIEAKGGNS